MRAPILVAALLAVASSAGASWMAAGGVEPSTPHDVSQASGYFFPDVEDDGIERVYFQAFLSVDQLTLNPNLATTDSRLLAPGAAHHRAMLGLWKDCNRDGHVGSAESALQDYPASALLDDSVCPARSGGHNDGQWVSEMVGVGMVDPCEYPEYNALPACAGIALIHRNERVVYVNHTMVWGDVGAPGEPPVRECPTSPPPGTASGTGALLAWIDCQDGRRIAGAVNTADADGTLGLRFEDVDHPERSSSDANVLFPATPFGGPQGAGLLEAGSDARAATVWDCRDAKAVAVVDPTGGLDGLGVEDPSGGPLTGPQPALPVVGVVTIFANDDEDDDTPGVLRVPVTDGEGRIAWVPAPAPTLDAPTGSYWDTAEHAADGPRGDCDPGTPSPLRAGAPGPAIESGAPPLDAARKDRASFSFTFYDGHRGLNERIDFALGSTAPSDGGLLYFRHGRGGDGPLWSADETTVNDPQLVTRGSLQPSGAQYYTYYVKLGEDFYAFGHESASTARFAYASEACQGEVTGERDGWVCDPALWWRDALGHDARPRYHNDEPYGPLPGERYHLRDVDCYDGSVGFGVQASLAVLSSLCPASPVTAP